MTIQQHIVNEIIVDGYLKAILYDNDVIEIFWDSSIDMIDVNHLKQMQQTVFELGLGKKMPLLFSPHEFLQLKPEGQKFAASEEGVKYSLAIAVLVDNLAKRILMNFFLKTSKPIVPTRGFSKREDAIFWLEKFEVFRE
ncbi:MAG: hypothetical protein V4622_14555 [Bacteroidota bacterium]